MGKNGRVVATKEETKGICINDVWYNAENVWKYAKGIKKGDNVEFGNEDKRGNPLTFIKKIDSTDIFKSGNEIKDDSAQFRTAEQIMRCVSIQSASRIISETDSKDKTNETIQMAKVFYNWIEKGG